MVWRILDRRHHPPLEICVDGSVLRVIGRVAPPFRDIGIRALSSTARRRDLPDQSRCRVRGGVRQGGFATGSRRVDAYRLASALARPAARRCRLIAAALRQSRNPVRLLPAAHGRAPARTPPHPWTTRPKLQSKCNLTAIRVQSGGKEPLRPTGCRRCPVGRPKSSPGQEIRPRLQLSINSGFLYTPTTANAAIWPTARSVCVGSDIRPGLRCITCRLVEAGAPVRSARACSPRTAGSFAAPSRYGLDVSCREKTSPLRSWAGPKPGAETAWPRGVGARVRSSAECPRHGTRSSVCLRAQANRRPGTMRSLFSDWTALECALTTQPLK